MAKWKQKLIEGESIFVIWNWEVQTGVLDLPCTTRR